MPSPRPTLAKILATIGPASDKPETIIKLIEAGVACFRINFSHGSFDDHLRRLNAIRAAAEASQRPGIAVLGDLPGPKIRIGKVPDCGGGGISVEPGQDFVIDPTCELSRPGATPTFATTYALIGRDLHPGQRVLINDGAIRALAVEKTAADAPGAVRCRVTTGGLITTGKGINLPQTNVSIPALTDRDWQCVEWAVRHGLDYLALSFVRTAAEVIQLQERLAAMCSVDGKAGNITSGAAIPVIAKIEKPQAVDNLDAIAAAADGLMVARGDLGVEMETSQVPVVQKMILAAADAYGKPCIVATQMLESMITSSQPTRAEASDIANAVFDGADAVMLSAETAAGQYPILAVDTMRRIIERAEAWCMQHEAQPSPPATLIRTGYRTAALAHGAWYVARDIKAKLIVCWSQRGGAARYLSQTGLVTPIVAYSSSAAETRRMALLKGVTALRMDPPADSSLSAWNRAVDDDLITRGWATPGDPIVLVAGRPLGVQGATNTLAVHYVANPTTGFYRH